MEDLTSRDYYFDSYAHFGIHEEMLKDDVRTTSYRTAIYQNRHLFQDKIVLDVGCGTGILSMFAVKAGAKHVYGVDMSNIIHQAKQIVQDNNMSDKITLIQAKMEEVQLPVQEVDIIVSEWMGYFLLYESMLDTVIVARDRYLKKEGGLIFPDCATMYLAAIEDEDYKAEKFGYWDNVYGFNYSSLKNVVMKEPLVDYVEAKAVVTSPFALKTLDLYTVTKADLAFEVPFKMKAARDDFVHAFVSWFDICFLRCPRTVRFSTGPHAKRTHWKQTVFYIDETLAIKGGEWIDGVLRSKPSENNPRHLEIEIDYDFQGALHQTQERREYKLAPQMMDSRTVLVKFPLRGRDWSGRANFDMREYSCYRRLHSAVSVAEYEERRKKILEVTAESFPKSRVQKIATVLCVLIAITLVVVLAIFNYAAYGNVLAADSFQSAIPLPGILAMLLPILLFVTITVRLLDDRRLCPAYENFTQTINALLKLYTEQDLSRAHWTLTTPGPLATYTSYVIVVYQRDPEANGEDLPPYGHISFDPVLEISPETDLGLMPLSGGYSTEAEGSARASQSVGPTLPKYEDFIELQRREVSLRLAQAPQSLPDAHVYHSSPVAEPSNDVEISIDNGDR